MAPKPHRRDFTGELEFITSRSGGPGGQHVNKVNTKVTLRFNIDQSLLLSEAEKLTVKEKLANKINNENVLVLSAEDKRSQLKNKEEAVRKFYDLLEQAFIKKKKRKPTKPTKASVEKRLEKKKIISEKKKSRSGYRPPDI